MKKHTQTHTHTAAAWQMSSSSLSCNNSITRYHPQSRTRGWFSQRMGSARSSQGAAFLSIPGFVRVGEGSAQLCRDRREGWASKNTNTPKKPGSERGKARPNHGGAPDLGVTPQTLMSIYRCRSRSSGSQMQ